MIEEILLEISKYGYLAIFLLVFLQEVGVPNPIPNELVLLLSGYLSSTGILNISIAILSAIAGDLLAITILYLIFYFFGAIIMNRKPKWLPLPYKKIENISTKIKKSGLFGIFIGRLTPFIKGYVTVLSGLMQVAPAKFAFISISTSVIWSVVYVCFGYLLGPYLQLITSNSSNIGYLILIITCSIIVLAVSIQLFKKLVSIVKYN
ncbi:MAG: DedA family protein [Paludibacter sp.]